MFNESSFIVRVSGRKENCYYIDYAGEYKIAEIARVTGLSPVDVKMKYSENGGSFDEELNIYYFSSVENAKKTIDVLLREMQPEHKGKPIYLTETEIEYIRKALINEGSNTIHVSSKVKDEIFKKLNK